MLLHEVTRFFRSLHALPTPARAVPRAPQMPWDRTSSVLTAQRAPPAQNCENGEPRRASDVGGVVRVRTTHRGISSSVPGGTQGLGVGLDRP